MSYCTGKAQGFIRFKYPETNWNQVKSTNPPLDYSFEQTEKLFRGGQCPDVAYEVKFSFYMQNGSDSLDGRVFYNRFFYGPITIELPYGNNTHTPNYETREMIIVEGSSMPPGGQYFTFQRYAFLGYGLYHFAYTYPFEPLPGWRYRSAYNTLAKGVETIRMDGQADNCGDPPGGECVFSVSDLTGQIYQQSHPVCPQVAVKCTDQCPPGTCECECGPRVCCYDPHTGKAVKSFVR